MDPSNETAMGLSENYHSFQLWYGILIAVAGTLVLSCIFISTVITCMQCRRKESVRHVHQIKPMTRKDGTQGSAFSVRSQGILELQSPHLNSALEEGGNLSIGRSQEQLQTDHQPIHTRETSVNADPGYQQVDAVASGDVVYAEVDNVIEGVGEFNRQSTGRQSVRSDAGRNIHFTRQSASRGSVRSESGISTGVHRRGGDGEGGRFGRHKPTSVSTHSMVGTRLLNRGSTDPQISFLIADDDDGNSRTSLPQISIHQVCSPRQEPASKHSISDLSDGIPGFCDPEILGGNNDSLEQLRIDLPPDIYSSQILNTVKSPEWEYEDNEEGANNEEGAKAFRIITETSKSTQSLTGETRSTDDRIMLVVSGDTTEEASEGFYDLPILNRDNLETLFDDPGYKRGFAGGRTWSATMSNAHVYHILEPPDSLAAPRSASLARRPMKYENITIGKTSDADSAMEEARWKRVMGYENVTLGVHKEVDSNGHTRSLTMEASQSAASKKDAVRYENVILGEQDVTGKGEVGVVNKGDVGVASNGEVAVGVASNGEGMVNINKGEEMGVASKGRMKGSVESLALLDFEDTELMELDPDIAACLALEPKSGRD